MISSNSVTLSAFVHNPTLPASLKVDLRPRTIVCRCRAPEAATLEVDAEAMPLLGNRNADPVAALPADNVERAAGRR